MPMMTCMEQDCGHLPTKSFLTRSGDETLIQPAEYAGHEDQAKET